MDLKQRSAVVLVNKDNKELLLMHRIKNGHEYYTILGGVIELDESPKEAAIREVKEESGLDVVLGDLFWEFEDEFHHGYYFITDTFYGVAELGGPELERNCQDNFYELEWVPVSNLRDVLLYPNEIKEKLEGLLKKY